MLWHRKNSTRTAGREQLSLPPNLPELNDDVLLAKFGAAPINSSLRDRSLATITSLSVRESQTIRSYIIFSQQKKNSITRTEIAELSLT